MATTSRLKGGDSALWFQHLITAITRRHLHELARLARRHRTLEGSNRILHMVVKENQALGREKGECLLQATALRMAADVRRS